MKKILILIVLSIGISLSLKAQLPMGSFGPYYFVANYDQNGDEMDIPGFETITLHVITTNFFGILQSSVFFSYEFGGQTQQSNSFEYHGISDGWYVYSFYNAQLLVSSDKQKILTTNPYGGMALYSK